MKSIKYFLYPNNLKIPTSDEAFLRKNHDGECKSYQVVRRHSPSEFLQKRRSKNLVFSGFVGILCVFLSCDLSAQELQAKFQDWNVFKAERGDRVVCYVASTPIKRDGSYDKRGEPYFLITNIVNDADEVSASSGFIYKKKSDVEVSFGSKKFYLFPYMSVAWANDKNEDIDIIKEMQKVEEFVVTGVTRDGKNSNDTYSLIGFSQAYAKMKEVCADIK